MLMEITNAVNMSYSIAAVHFTGNPGLTEEIQTRIMAKLKATHEK
jgi:hypothetical protein